MASSHPITTYGWSDGTKTVSVYVTLSGLDRIPDDCLSGTVTHGWRGFVLEIAPSSSFANARTLAIHPLHGKITAARLVRKRGKDMVVVRLTKAAGEAWPNLRAAAGTETTASDDEEYLEASASADDGDDTIPVATTVSPSEHRSATDATVLWGEAVAYEAPALAEVVPTEVADGAVVVENAVDSESTLGEGSA